MILLISNISDTRKTPPPIINFTIEKKVLDNRAEKLDTYFRSKEMPISGSGKYFIREADEHGLDWKLLAAISVQESSGGKRMPEGSYNAFGWNSGNYTFDNFENAIEYISDKFENGKYYIGKDTLGILKTYNPPSVNKNYPNEVINIMKNIETGDGRSTPLDN